MRTGRLPTRALRSLLSRRSERYTIYEQAGDTESWNDGQSSLVETGERVPLDIYGQQSTRQSYPTGEVSEARLRGLMDAREKTDDIVDGTYVVHGGSVFEVTYDAWPDARDAVVYTLSLSEQTDIQPP